jgi:hypothetical protein
MLIRGELISRSPALSMHGLLLPLLSLPPRREVARAVEKCDDQDTVVFHFVQQPILKHGGAPKRGPTGVVMSTHISLTYLGNSKAAANLPSENVGDFGVARNGLNALALQHASVSRGLALLSEAFAARLGRLSAAKQAALRTLLEKLN